MGSERSSVSRSNVRVYASWSSPSGAASASSASRSSSAAASPLAGATSPAQRLTAGAGDAYG